MAANPRHHQHTLHFSRCGQRGTGRKRRNFIACSGNLGFTKILRIKLTYPEINNNLRHTVSSQGSKHSFVEYQTWDFPRGSDDKESACNAGDLGSIPGLGSSPEKEMATHSSILAWRIPWTEEPGGLLSGGHMSWDMTERVIHTQACIAQ